MSLTSTQTMPPRTLAVKPVGLNVLDYSNRNLYGVRGAKQLIADISKRRTFSKLLLSHNPIGSEGYELLFKFLKTKGSRFKIVELHLNDTNMGMEGLAALSQYIDGNQTLKELALQSNGLASEPQSILLSFIESLNTCPSLANLHLSTNPGLGDAFSKLFFSRIQSPTLSNLYLAMDSLSSDSVPDICSFLSCPGRSHSLKTLSLNGNNIGLEGSKGILETIEKTHWWLEDLQLSGNGLGPAWKDLEPRARKVFFRNERLRRSIEADALRLLHHSRPLLLPSSSTSVPLEPPLLPLELVLYILSYLTLHLSPDQLVRIQHYASNPGTLPQVVPKTLIPSHPNTCIPDPTSMPDTPVNSGTPKPRPVLWPTINGSNTKGGCGDCENYLVCHREKERRKFLETVGCTGFELG